MYSKAYQGIHLQFEVIYQAYELQSILLVSQKDMDPIYGLCPDWKVWDMLGIYSGDRAAVVSGIHAEIDELAAHFCSAAFHSP